MQSQLIRTNVTRGESQRLKEEYSRFTLTRRLSFAGFIREKLFVGPSTSVRLDREALLLETLQRLQDCRLALNAMDGEERDADHADADHSDLAATLQRIDHLVERLATWWFD